MKNYIHTCLGKQKSLQLDGRNLALLYVLRSVLFPHLELGYLHPVLGRVGQGVVAKMAVNHMFPSRLSTHRFFFTINNPDVMGLKLALLL